jgi:glycosyltransferase involved in cell wall biosynthesis
MRVAYILTDFPVLSETFIGDEMRAMMALGHVIHPIVFNPATGPSQDADRALAAGAWRLSERKTRRAALPGLLRHQGVARAASFVMRQKLLKRGSLMWNAVRIAARIRETGSTHIHAHFAGGAAAHAIVAGHLLGLPVTFTCHGHDIYSEPEDLELKLTQASAVIATCADMARDLRTIAPRADVRIVYCGIDPSAFPFSPVPAPAPRFLFIGRLVEQKGVDDIIAALADIASETGASLDIAGEGPQDGHLRALAGALGLADRVTFLGRRQRSWFIENGRTYAALVCPFRTGPNGERDSGPMVVKEAMALGLPVVSTRYMGVKEMVPEGTGFLVEPGAREPLADAMKHVLGLGESERMALARRARRHFEEGFTLQQQALDLTALFQELSARTAARPCEVAAIKPFDEFKSTQQNITKRK